MGKGGRASIGSAMGGGDRMGGDEAEGGGGGKGENEWLKTAAPFATSLSHRTSCSDSTVGGGVFFFLGGAFAADLFLFLGGNEAGEGPVSTSCFC